MTFVRYVEVWPRSSNVPSWPNWDQTVILKREETVTDHFPGGVADERRPSPIRERPQKEGAGSSLPISLE